MLTIDVESLAKNYRELLSETRLNLLKAIASGITEGFSRHGILTRFRLGTSANVSEQKKVLYEKELIDIRNSKPEFPDPAYELWFIKHVLRTNLPFRGLPHPSQKHRT